MYEQYSDNILDALISTHNSLLAVIRNYSHTCACAVYINCSYYSKVASISFRVSNCAVTIQEGNYSKKYVKCCYRTCRMCMLLKSCLVRLEKMWYVWPKQCLRSNF